MRRPYPYEALDRGDKASLFCRDRVENGGFKITGVPPGKYKVIAWHEPWKLKGKEKGGRLLYEPVEGVTLAQELITPPRGEAKVSFTFK